MNCFNNKKINVVKNEIFDLMDTNGDDKLSKEELGIVAKHIWTADIQSAKNYVTQLQVRDPVDHVHLLLNTKKATKSHLKNLYGRLSHDKWRDEVLPELQRAELKRLNKVVSKN